MKASTQALINVLESERDKHKKTASQAQARFNETHKQLDRTVAMQAAGVAERHQKRIDLLVRTTQMSRKRNTRN